MSRLLLLSNSTMPGTPFFEWPSPHVSAFLKDQVEDVLFIPFAAVTLAFNVYEEMVKAAFMNMGYQVRSIHHYKNPVQAVENAATIVVGGGNTFALLKRMYDHKLVEVVREKVVSGIPYIGWSAGANLACPTIKTTNDMPILQPHSFEALNLVPFQINPHYSEYKQPGHGGETRQQRIEEFLKVNKVKVVGLPEGSLIRKENENVFVEGGGIAKLFKQDGSIEEISSGSKANFLFE